MQNTKRAFLISVTSMLLCVALLIGSTFAWFTDSVSTGINTIEAGNLDIEMYFAAGKLDPAGATYTNAANNKIFDYDLWEPGYTVARHIKISNLGNLAAKYAVHFDVAGEVGSLAEVIDVYFIDPAQAVANRTDLATLTPYGTLAQVLNGNAVPGDLEGGKSNIVTIVLKMQESAGNAYKNATVGDLTIHLVATQDTVEADSFGTDYDTNAKVPVPVSSMEDLTKALGQMEENGVVMLTAPLTVTGMTDGDMNGKTGTIDFNGTTATGSNLNIAFRVREGSVGTIQNGTIVAEANTYSTISAAGGSTAYVKDMVLYNSNDFGNNIKCFSGAIIYVEDTTVHSYLGGCVESAGGTVYVTNCNFDQTGDANSANAMFGSASNGGSLTVYSGTYTSENYGLYAFRSGGTITVYDGTFTAAKAVLKADSYTTEPAGVFFIHGGSFDGSIEISEGSSLTITGGTFKNTGLSLEQFKAYVADGHTVTEANGVYTVR